MLTFDQIANSDPTKTELELLMKGVTLPDLVECGENNAVWINVRRSTKMLELVSRQTGMIVTKCPVSDLSVMSELGPTVAEMYGLTLQQVGAVNAALRLGK